MKKITIFILSLLFFTACSIYEATYQEKALEIDGSSSDWTTSLDKKGKSDLYYSITNDSENLYVRLNTSNQSIQQKIHMNGLSIWIDTTGKKNKQLGIKCPINRLPQNMNKRSMSNREQQIVAWDKNQLMEADFFGFNNEHEQYFVASNPYDVEISISQDEFKSFYYEVKIPFSSMNLNYVNLCKQTFSMGFIIEAIEMPSSPGMNGGGRPQGGGGGRSQGTGGGQMGGGGPQGMTGGASARPDQSEIQELTAATIIWVKNIQLSKN